MKKKIARTSQGKFLKGNPSGPGRPKGSANKYNIAELFTALRTVEKKKRKKLLARYCERAFVSDKCMLHLMDKLLPSLRSVEVYGALLSESMDDDTARSIQQKLKDRFK